eukprot:scaffold43085_cov216-Skeletonema_dohrnii-CCMP3373.AAC.2
MACAALQTRAGTLNRAELTQRKRSRSRTESDTVLWGPNLKVFTVDKNGSLLSTLELVLVFQCDLNQTGSQLSTTTMNLSGLALALALTRSPVVAAAANQRSLRADTVGLRSSDGIASYDEALGIPKCNSESTSCDTGNLLNGRGA